MKNLLVVDDNKCIRDLLSLMANTYLTDCRVHLAENGAKAAGIFDALPVDTIVTDLSMPVMDGYQFMEYVRRRSPSVPIIAMTADAGIASGETLKSLGVKRCLDKPFDIRDAVSEIASALGQLPHVSDKARPRTASGFGLQTS